MTLEFLKSSKSQTVTVPVGTSSTLGFTPLISTSVSGTKVINGRVRFKVNSGSSLQCKIFAVDASQADWKKRAGITAKISSADLNLIDPATNKTYGSKSSATGVYSNIQRYGALDTSEYAFAMGKFSNGSVISANNNTNEFQNPTDTLPFSQNGNLGNYGIFYAFYGTNTNAKKVTLTPKQSSSGRYVVKVNGTWVSTDASKTSPAKFTLTSGTSFWFVLPGGNYGDVSVQYST